MLISFCIPTYGHPAAPLVRQLWRQAGELLAADQFEVIVSEDASGRGQVVGPDTEAVTQLGLAVRYVVQPVNLGRAANRNAMARMARGAWLCMIDADSELPDERFVARYLEGRVLAPQAHVLVGGTAYREDMPAGAHLRWHYGRAREAVPARARNGEPYHRLALNNVLVRRTTWLAHPLEEGIVRYGHEDTLWGLELGRAYMHQPGIVWHLDNPVIHTGLEADADFYAKAMEGARTLGSLIWEGRLASSDTRLSAMAARLGWVGPLVGGLLRAAHPLWRRLAPYWLPALDLGKLGEILAEIKVGR